MLELMESSGGGGPGLGQGTKGGRFSSRIGGSSTPPARSSPSHSREGSPLLLKRSSAHPPLAGQHSAPPVQQYHERLHASLKRSNSLKRLLKLPIFGGQTGEKGSSSVGGSSGVSNKEQRRSDPGSVVGVVLGNHHPNNTNAATTNNTYTASNASTSTLTGGDLPNNSSDALEEYGSPDFPTTNSASSDGAPPTKHSLQQHKKKSGTPVNRSESLKEKQHGRKRTRESRKHSDPNIPTSKSGDVDAESGLITANSGSSSNSSLSPSLESPSTSLEHVPRTDAPLPAPVLENDSDIEAEVDLPNWQKLVSDEEIKKLKPKDRKRQDTINELFHTERTHVRVLKVLKHLFQVPMTEAGLLPRDQLDILFPNMDQMLKIHTAFNQAMKKRRLEEPLVSRVGDLLINMTVAE